jgi:hypothetical protein
MHEGVPLSLFLPFLPGLLVGGLCAGIALWGAARAWRSPWVASLWFQSVLPVLLALGIAWLGLKAFNPRYAAASFPAFVLLLAVGTRHVLDRRRAVGSLLVGGLVLASLTGWARQSFDARYAREDHRGAAAYLSGVAGPGDLILEQGVHGLLERYYRGPAPVVPFYAAYREAPGAGAERLAELVAGREVVWWVGSRLWFEDPDRTVREWITSRGTAAGRWEGNGIEVVGVRVRSAP